jgi:signal transduction histidine kinase
MDGSIGGGGAEREPTAAATALPDGEMAALIAAKDWTATSLGPPDRWSPSLRMMTSFLLANRFPLLLWWGPDHISIYNDAYRPILGTKHPWALGLPVRECWSEIWHVLRPLVETPFTGGPSTWSEDLELELRRRGFLEETHFTVAYSPVPDETAPNAIGGVLATVHEITAQVVGERRVGVLRDLGARSAEAATAEEACAIAAEALARHPKDVPFALVYLIAPDGRAARLAGAAGVEAGGPGSPLEVALDGSAGAGDWPLTAVTSAETAQVVEDLRSRFGAVPQGPWSDPPKRALVLPIRSNLPHHLAGVLVAGVSARLELDASYRSFFDLVTAQLATGIANARAYEEERQRAVALAELDRAKTAFFSNVSHEFRTPLTLMLGHVEDGLDDAADPLAPGQRARQETVHRNALRLLKLVNSLLDFSRIEAGRVQASYEPTDVAALTAEVASAFRSLLERAGLRFTLDCPPLAEPVFVDREMWEKIVLNLVSNAFKFTFEGEIAVRVESDAASLRLTVRDTGTGVDAEHLPHLFERFYRVPDARGRTYEGTGIGLALVRELTKLHGGSASVESESGRGTTFTVTVPRGSAHLPRERIRASRTLASTAIRATAFVEEAAGWVDGAAEVAAALEPPGAVPAEEGDAAGEPAHILVADDNADMRAYLARLLRPLGEVEAVADGVQALAAIGRRVPDLVLSDVMMPNLDGFGLLRALREDERTRMLPIVLLSARAGEEASVEGMSAGADDYVVKPFASRELVARIRSQLQLARQRREHADALARSEEALREANRELAEGDRRKDEFLAVLSHELRNPLAPIRNSTHILERAAPGSEQARRALAVIDRQVSQLTRLVDDLLDVTRISRNKVHLQLERLDLDDLVRRTVEDQRSVFEAAGVRLELEPARAPLFVDGDANRLAQIVGNLLQNAAKFTPRGGAAKVSVSADAAAGCAVIRVADTGVGMSPDLISRLFLPFTQADSTLDRSKGGLGLGLALVKALVALHRGDVAAHSAGVGAGAELVVRLPLAERAAAAEPAAAPVARGRRVLLIEDNVDAADSLRELLELAGHEVLVAHDGPEGLAKALVLRPEVVLCDIGLPGMDGYAVARALRAEASLAGACLVALSGYALPQDVRRARDAGFDFHLSKPPRLDKLAALFDGIAAARARAPGVEGGDAAGAVHGAPPAGAGA